MAQPSTSWADWTTEDLIGGHYVCYNTRLGDDLCPICRELAKRPEQEIERGYADLRAAMAVIRGAEQH